MVRYAGQVLHTFKSYKIDERTTRQRIRGDPSTPDVPKFGESVYYKPAKTIKIPKDEPRWCEVIWTGFIDHTNEHIICTDKGTMKCRAIRRKDESEQFSATQIEQIKRTPWELVPNRNNMRIPINIEETREILDDEGNVEGHYQEGADEEERLKAHADPEEDADIDHSKNKTRSERE